MEVLKGLGREENEIEICKACKLCLKGKIDMSTSSRKAEMAVRGETNQELESQRLQLQQANSGLIRLKERRLIHAENWK